MKVTVDLDPRDVWRIQEKADKAGVRPGDVLREELGARRDVIQFHNRVRARVLAGMCDADIATELRMGVTAIRDIRQKHLRLPANRRYGKRNTNG